MVASTYCISSHKGNEGEERGKGLIYQTARVRVCVRVLMRVYGCVCIPQGGGQRVTHDEQSLGGGLYQV